MHTYSDISETHTSTYRKTMRSLARQDQTHTRGRNGWQPVEPNPVEPSRAQRRPVEPNRAQPSPTVRQSKTGQGRARPGHTRRGRYGCANLVEPSRVQPSPAESSRVQSSPSEPHNKTGQGIAGPGKAGQGRARPVKVVLAPDDERAPVTMRMVAA